jgi:PAS domain S-box-containing protein
MNANNLKDSLSYQGRKIPDFTVVTDMGVIPGKRTRMGVSVLLLFVLGMLLSVGWLAFHNMTAAMNADREEIHTYLVINEMAGLLSAIKDAETGQRGFLITGDQNYLEPYRASLSEIEQHLTILHRETAGNPRQRQHLAIIAPQVTAKLAELKQTIMLRQTKGFPIAQEVVLSHLGKNLMNIIRREVDQFQQEEMQFLHEQSVAKEAGTRKALRQVVLGSSLACLLLVVLLITHQWEYSRRRHAEVKVRAHQENIIKLLETQRRLNAYNRNLLEASLDPLVTIDPEGKITDVNHATEQVTGCLREALIGTVFADYFTEPTQAQAGFAQVFKEGSVWNYPLEIRHQDGHLTDVLYNATVYRDDSGSAIGVFAAARDITELKHAEKEREQYFRFFMTSRDLMCIADPNGAFIRTNPAFSETLGYSEAELVSKPFIDFIHPDDKQQSLDEMNRQMAIGHTLNFDNRYICADGSVCWLSWRAIYNKEDKATFATARDITVSKHQEEALRKSEHEFRSLAEAMPQIVWITRPDGWNIYFNQQWVDYTGLTLEESSGHGWNKPYHPDDQQRAWDAWQNATKMKGTYSLECRLRRADGTYQWWLVRGVPVFDENGAVSKWFGTCTDIDEFKKAEEELHRANTYNRSLIEASLDPLVTIGPDGRITDVNSATERATGSPRDELVGTDFSDYFTDPGQARAGYEQVFQDGLVRDYPLEIRHREGHTTPVLYNASVYRDESGCVAGVFAAARDITERKETEETIKRNTAELERSNAELQQFAYVASHDLQEPLRMVSSFTQLLAKRYEGQLDDKAKKYIDYAVDGAVRMQRLINDLLLYSRINTQGKMPELIDSQTVLGEALRNLSAAIGESRAIITNDDLPTVRADATQLTQLFQNLIGNALKFRGVAIPCIRIAVRDEGPEWCFSVQDNGIGIAPQYAEQVFVIFQRLHTRQEYPGTGIGLALCKRIVERHGGRIWFESEQGKGCTFYFTLPKRKGVLP